jgi:hypothetical protein
MLTCRYFAECSLQLWQGKVDSVILDIFAKTIDGLQKYVHFSEVAANTLVLTKRRARFQSLPAPQFHDNGPRQDSFGDFVRIRLKDFNLSIGQVVPDVANMYQLGVDTRYE